MEKLLKIEEEVARLASTRVTHLVHDADSADFQAASDRNLHVKMVDEAERGIRILEAGIDDLGDQYQELHDQMIRQQQESADEHRKTREQLTQMVETQQEQLHRHTEEMFRLTTQNRSLDETQWKIQQVLQACGHWVAEVQEELQDQIRKELTQGLVWETPKRLTL